MAQEAPSEVHIIWSYDLTTATSNDDLHVQMGYPEDNREILKCNAFQWYLLTFLSTNHRKRKQHVMYITWWLENFVVTCMCEYTFTDLKVRILMSHQLKSNAFQWSQYAHQMLKNQTISLYVCESDMEDKRRRASEIRNPFMPAAHGWHQQSAQCWS